MEGIPTKTYLLSIPPPPLSQQKINAICTTLTRRLTKEVDITVSVSQEKQLVIKIMCQSSVDIVLLDNAFNMQGRLLLNDNPITRIFDRVS
jgi:hypothetical protein